ncbi:hypothetical protein DBR17_07975 [Sphingomonas sp. HMWF008]|nr:hypothetical protein DBR17_07975 [Sphingomonas sp. HMWF008]
MSNGNLLVTWVDADFTTTAGRFIRGQVFQPDGTPVGGELTLVSGSSLILPAVVGLAGGGFALTWQEGGLRAQVFDAAGASVGGVITVSPATASSAQLADIAALSNGGFAISWHDTRTTGADVSGTAVRVRSFSATGVADGADILVNTSLAGNQADSAITALAEGRYVVTWTDRGAAGSGSPWVIKGQIFTPSGARTGSEFIVNATTAGAGSVESSVTTLSNGNFAVAWYDGGSHHIRIFTATGLALGAELTVQAAYSGTQVGPALAALSNGGLVLAWTTSDAPTSDGSGRAIYVQAFDANAQAVSGPLLVNTQTNGDQIQPSVVALDNGAFSVTWTDLNGPGADDDEVRTQIFTTDAPAPPPAAVTIISSGGGATASVSAAENGTLATQVQATPASTSQSISYAIIGGVDAARFTINTATGALSFVNAPNFEASTDVGANNVYDVIVSASDGTLSDTQAIAISVTDVNEVPSIYSSATFSAAENQLVAGQVLAKDPESAATALTIVGGADAARFTINSATGVLSFVAAPDYEAPNDVGANRVYDVIVQASDGALSTTQTIAITVTNVVEPVSITSGGGGASAALSAVENVSRFTPIYTVTASNLDGGSLSYSIVGGPDAARFTIDSTRGTLNFAATPNFESPVDAGADNVYDIVVQASNGITIDTQALAIAVVNVNEAPAITGGAARAISIAENQTTVTTVVGVDPEQATVSYSISGGVDAAFFAINALTGALSFLSARDFEVHADSGANNVYDVIVRASDGVLASAQSIAVTITNVNEAPVITSNGAGDTASISVLENATAVTTVTSTDPEGSARTYSILGGVDAARFTINATTGALAFVSAPNFEAPTDANADNVYQVVVRASDGTLVDSQAISVTVSNVNEAVAITSNGGGDSAALSVGENGSVVTAFTATDLDGTAPTYMIVGGADAARFTIDAITGALRFVSAPDFEAPGDAGANNVYDVIVRATDGALFDSQAITVTVTNVNEAPVIAGDAFAAVAENQLFAAAVTAIDSDSSNLLYAISGGADGALFEIDAATGMVSFRSAPDFEAPDDADANNVYDMIVSVTDGDLTDSRALAITVTNVDEGEILTTAATSSIVENSTGVETIAAGDLDSDSLTYVMKGDADGALLTISPRNGLPAFKVAPNFEARSDDGTNNVYDAILSDTGRTSTVAHALADIVTESTLTGTIAANMIDGTTAADTIYGLADNDTLSGFAGNDVLNGGSGNHLLVDGAGKYKLLGSTGADTFHFGLVIEPTDGSANSVVDLFRFDLNNVSVNPISASALLKESDEYSSIDGSILYNISGKLHGDIGDGHINVFGDVNRGGISDFINQLSGQIDLIAADFVI